MAETKKKAAENNGHEDNVTPISPTELGELEPDPEYMPTYSIRSLHSGDTIRIFRMVRAASAEESIMNAAINGGQTAAVQELIHVLLGTVEDDMVPWLLEICGMKDKNLEDLPPEAIPDMIADLSSDKGFLRVFKSAARASHAIRRISSLFRTAPESQSDSE